MIKPLKRLKLIMPVTLLLALLVALAGCAAGQSVTAQEVIDKMRETMKTTQTVQGVVDLDLTINKAGLNTLAASLMPGMAGSKSDDHIANLPDVVTATLKVWKQAPDKLRVEVDRTTLPNASGGVLVYDGQKFYALDPSRNKLYTGTPDKLADKSAQWSAVMQSGDIEAQLDKLLAASDVKLLGSERVANLDAYKLEVTPKPNAAELLDIPPQFRSQVGVLIKDGKATLWVDKDRWIPLKVVLEHPNMGQFTYTATDLTLNQPIDPSQFVLQAPAGAETIDLDAKREQAEPQSMTIQQARDQAAKAGWKLLEPTYVPDNATLVEVSRIGQPARSAFLLSYSSSTADFTIAQSNARIDKQLGDVFSGRSDDVSSATREVTVRGVQAYLFSPPEASWTALIWQEKDNGIFVAIRGKLSVDEAVKIAEGLK